jgi:DNA processing protein
MNQRDSAALRLHLTKGLGRARLLQLMKAFAEPQAILEADPRDWELLANVNRKFAEQVPAIDDPAFCSRVEVLDQASTSIITFCDSRYPELLKTIADPPALLYLRGTLPEGPALAVVGARKASERDRAGDQRGLALRIRRDHRERPDRNRNAAVPLRVQVRGAGVAQRR